MQRTVKIRDLNAHIVCSLCAGYYIDATTITECLHTFCRSCIVKYLYTKRCCPQCGLKVHETQPLSSLKADRVLQEIVFKLIPGLHKEESKRLEEFEGSHKAAQTTTPAVTFKLPNDLQTRTHHFYNDSPIYFCLQEIIDEKNKNLHPNSFALKDKLIRASERTIVAQIRNLVLHHLIDPLVTKPIRDELTQTDLIKLKNAEIGFVTKSLINDTNNKVINNKNNKNKSSKNNNTDDINNIPNEQTNSPIIHPISYNIINTSSSTRPMSVELYDSCLRSVSDVVTLRQLWLRRSPISEIPIQLHFRLHWDLK